MRLIIALPAAFAWLLVLTGTVSATTAHRWTETRVIENTFSCGVVEHTTATIDGTAYFADDGTWLRDFVRFRYVATYNDRATGRTIDYRTRQVAEFTPDTGTLRGQGTFVRVPGDGVLLRDVGRLVFDPRTGETVFESAHVISFEDPDPGSAYDAAICAAFAD